MNRLRHPSPFALIATVVLLVAGLTLRAESRLLRGVITREGVPVEGAVVKIKDVATLQLQSYITGADGEYHFAGLRSDADYQVWATRQGHRSSQKTLSRFDSKPESTLDLVVN